MRPEKAAFTIAVGRDIYWQMAIALARSFGRWHRNSAVEFHIATDRTAPDLPKDIRWVKLIPLRKGQYGEGFTPKLYLDKIAPGERSIFIDADCVCVRTIEPAFDAFAGHAVSVIGREFTHGEWFGDMASVCRQFELRAMPGFNGGVYYIEHGEKSRQIYETARALLPRYDEIGFVRLRNCPNEEVLMSVAMAIHGEKPIPDKGDIMSGPYAAGDGWKHLEVDTLNGEAVLRYPKLDPNTHPWHDIPTARPALVHFLGTDVNTYPYRQEIQRLGMVGGGWPEWLATAWTKATFSLPWILGTIIKDALRPTFHALLGPRRIGPGHRF